MRLIPNLSENNKCELQHREFLPLILNKNKNINMNLCFKNKNIQTEVEKNSHNELFLLLFKKLKKKR